ncbi:hypothetical protein GGF32_006462 [Allomyces javanicus]|nr:hypothetical protein GGF32_006462 [Allomyces javanicus]
MALRTLFRLFAARVPDTRITVQQFNKCLVDLGLEVVREYSREDQMVLNVVRNIRVARL